MPKPAAFPHDERIAWASIALMGVATLTGLRAAGFSLRWASAAAPLLGCGALCAIAFFYRSARKEPRLAATCAALAQLVLFTMIAGPLTYLAAALDRPLIDGALLRADAALGFHWPAYLALIDAHPAFAALLRLAYETTLPQLAMALCLLGFTGRLGELRRFVWAVIGAGLAVSAISAFWPALGAYAYLDIPASAYAHIQPSDAWAHVPDLLGARDGSLRLLSLDRLQGLIAFPSFHAALAALFAWAFWQDRRARWPGLAAEALVLLSTPIDGAHYLSDVLAGIATAAASLGGARWALNARGSAGQASSAGAPQPA